MSNVPVTNFQNIEIIIIVIIIILHKSYATEHHIGPRNREHHHIQDSNKRFLTAQERDVQHPEQRRESSPLSYPLQRD